MAAVVVAQAMNWKMRLIEGEHEYRLPISGTGACVFLRSMPARRRIACRRVVLYLHGATFPSALSIAFRVQGRSWRDVLTEAGFEVWALDFLGFGLSDRFQEMEQAADSHPPLGVAAEAVVQVETAARFILDREQVNSISLITHSWGSMPADLFAAAHPTLVDRVFMFAPLACREGPRYVPRPMLPAWKLVSNEEQWARFVEDVPPNERPVLSRTDFAEWAEVYLDSDPHARQPSSTSSGT
jgi:pimeloyl-ACP methyl ester carboxylesterase